GVVGEPLHRWGAQQPARGDLRGVRAAAARPCCLFWSAAAKAAALLCGGRNRRVRRVCARGMSPEETVLDEFPGVRVRHEGMYAVGTCPGVNPRADKAKPAKAGWGDWAQTPVIWCPPVGSGPGINPRAE